MTNSHKRTAEDKILSVLDAIKDQNDLNPKGSYSVSSGPYGRTHKANEVRIYTQKLMEETGVEYVELEKILAKLKEDEMITRFQIISEFA